MFELQRKTLAEILKEIVAEYSERRKYITVRELIDILTQKYGYKYNYIQICGDDYFRFRDPDLDSLGITYEFLENNDLNYEIFNGNHLTNELLPSCLVFSKEYAKFMESEQARLWHKYIEDTYCQNDSVKDDDDYDDDYDHDYNNIQNDYSIYGGGPTGDLSDDVIDSVFDGDPRNYWNID